MNAKQRKRLTEARDIIEEIAEDERSKRDNAPENLWDSEKYTRMEEVADLLDECVMNLDEAIDN